MDIDKFYRVTGNIFKRIFYKTVKKPVQSFNVENRAQKKLSKQKESAPWHETTRKHLEQIKKESNFSQLDSKNANLLDRLKSVKVDELDKLNMEKNLEYEQQTTSSRKMPQNRFGPELPFVFYRPEKTPLGKINVLDVFDIILSHKKENVSATEIAEKYNVPKEDIENILKYVDTFTIISTKDNKEIPLYAKHEESATPSLESPKENDPRKEITDK